MSRSDRSAAPDEIRVLVLAPSGRDATLACRMLAEQAVAAEPCGSIGEFCRELERGAGAGVLVEEALTPAGFRELARVLSRQPPWSELPLIVLLGHGEASGERTELLQALAEMGNATLLERPMRRDTLVSAVRVALRSRRRQYEIRDHLIEREQTAEALRQSEERFRIALESSPILMAMVDRDQRYSWIYNPPAGLQAQELVGRRLDEVLPAEDVAELTRLRDEVLACEHGIRREIALVLPDGRHHYDVTAEPLRDAAGKVVGVTTAASDITERRRAQATRARLAAIVESSFDAILGKSLDGTITSWNAAAQRLYGYTPDEMIGRNVTTIVPEDRRGELRAVFDALARGESVPPFETVRRRKDGRLIDVSVTISPIRDASGVVTGASVVARDITEQRRAAEHQEMLLAELSHRVKNNMAVVLSIASQTARRSSSLDDFLPAFKGRILALASAHTLLSAVDWKGAELRTVIDEVTRQAKAGEGRVSIDGESVLVQPEVALTLSLVLHELTSNALRHGALRCPDGRVTVEWAIEANGSGQRLRLRWRETGGERVSRSATRGFGLDLIERAVTYELSGRTRMSYRPDGLCCEISLPWTERVGELPH